MLKRYIKVLKNEILLPGARHIPIRTNVKEITDEVLDHCIETNEFGRKYLGEDREALYYFRPIPMKIKNIPSIRDKFRKRWDK